MSTEGNPKEPEFYKKAQNYWSTVEPTVNGMLGGYPQVSSLDATASIRFLCEFFTPIQSLKEDMPSNCAKRKKLDAIFPEGRRCLDCGAGIGRVSREVLLKFFDTVDLLEQNPHFLEKARDFIGPDTFDKRIGNTFPIGLQEFDPDPSIEYDLIWCQWVVGHLTDDDFVVFLKKCKSVLNKKHGMIVIKDNHTSSDESDADTRDSSVTRPYWLLKKIFKQAELEVIRERKQYKFPAGLYPVKMFALR